MTFAPPDIMRKLRPSTPKAPSDIYTLLGSRLKCSFDARFGFETGNKLWQAHKDLAQGIVVRAPSGQEPLQVVDGSNFRKVPVIGIRNAGSRKMVGPQLPALVNRLAPIETFCVARSLGQTPNGVLVGYADAPSTSSGGSWIITNSAFASAVSGGVQVTVAFTDTASVHLFESIQDGTNTYYALDGSVLASFAIGFRASAAQLSVGGFELGTTSSADANVAAWGVISPPLSDAERVIFTDILRHEWGF